ncbi:MAG: chorismate synthase [Candidatus Bathyarchaeota archaeon]|nr:chorismate synthase [Candidatus Bathyarchaeota archaeon]
MAGNSIGKAFVITTFGESHGDYIGVLIDGCPAGLSLTNSEIDEELAKRIPKQSKIVSERKERDTVQIFSGVFNGVTTGAPICLVVKNKEMLSSDYELIKDLPRPGHADYPARIRYGGFNDYRGGGRFSGRGTVALIMAGTIAKKLLALQKIEVLAFTKAIGKIEMEKTISFDEVRKLRYESSVRCPDLASSELMEKSIIKAKSEGNSVGGIVECVSLNVPAGVGDPVFDSLDSDIAKIILAIPAVKGVDFGVGFMAAKLKGSENNDQYALRDDKIVTTSNNAGGILGGLSSGMPIILSVAFKPTPSIGVDQKTVNLKTMKETKLKIAGRHDPCVVPKAVPVVESAVAIVLIDHLMRGGFLPNVIRENK